MTFVQVGEYQWANILNIDTIRINVPHSDQFEIAYRSGITTNTVGGYKSKKDCMRDIELILSKRDEEIGLKKQLLTELRELKEAILYRPGGSIFQEAKEDFEKKNEGTN